MASGRRGGGKVNLVFCLFSFLFVLPSLSPQPSSHPPHLQVAIATGCKQEHVNCFAYCHCTVRRVFDLTVCSVSQPTIVPSSVRMDQPATLASLSLLCACVCLLTFASCLRSFGYRYISFLHVPLRPPRTFQALLPNPGHR
ncbi:hypothetical protein QBC45DRAFT_12060 [Copromyces sp. CBS 386.78]|nr:hypothetical protein QBC45DRAFT_12060 [Copromyces sp. CBS 386.78]